MMQDPRDDFPTAAEGHALLAFVGIVVVLVVTLGVMAGWLALS